MNLKKEFKTLWPRIEKATKAGNAQELTHLTDSFIKKLVAHVVNNPLDKPFCEKAIRKIRAYRLQHVWDKHDIEIQGDSANSGSGMYTHVDFGGVKRKQSLCQVSDAKTPKHVENKREEPPGDSEDEFEREWRECSGEGIERGISERGDIEEEDGGALGEEEGGREGVGGGTPGEGEYKAGGVIQPNTNEKVSWDIRDVNSPPDHSEKILDIPARPCYGSNNDNNDSNTNNDGNNGPFSARDFLAPEILKPEILKSEDLTSEEIKSPGAQEDMASEPPLGMGTKEKTDLEALMEKLIKEIEEKR